ncbi:hypothetical protein E4U43_008304 [Claviceps pusilla]|uniref:Uncharacterized protein n=1 Tax=Claviceps pusilla TaxID=123648 RepID=A0A9P7NCZ9_9HYPO|nr:hypothetical protein E4U43_008304 [Claviceps pusilla]
MALVRVPGIFVVSTNGRARFDVRSKTNFSEPGRRPDSLRMNDAENDLEQTNESVQSEAPKVPANTVDWDDVLSLDKSTSHF